MKKRIYISLFLLVVAVSVHAQEYAYGHFEGTRIINGHSVETLKEGEMEFVIAHRFGRINGGAYELFGLDQANIRFGLDYGINNWATVGMGRSSLGKHYDGFLKVRILRQKLSDPFSVSLTALGSVAINTLKAPSANEPILFRSRLAYTTQFILAKKIRDRLAFQLMPTLVHFNLVETPDLKNDVIAIGMGGKYQLNKALTLTAEYYLNLPDQLANNKTNSLAIGVDLNTGSHVFQLHFTNSFGMIEKAFIGETTGEWGAGDIHFGFNMVRTFKLKGRRY